MIKFKADFVYKNKLTATKLIKALNGNPYVSGLTLSADGDDYNLTVTFTNAAVRDSVAEKFNGLTKKE